MSVIRELLSNDILLAGICGWFVAQILKTIIYAVVNREFELERLVGDGGMPSAHSATVTALATMTGMQCGFSSPFFALASIMAIIVMHDAMGVRRETGKQAKLINEMIELFGALEQPQLSVETKLKEFIGHTPMQVAAGMLLGIGVAVAYYYLRLM